MKKNKTGLKPVSRTVKHGLVLLKCSGGLNIKHIGIPTLQRSDFQRFGISMNENMVKDTRYTVGI